LNRESARFALAFGALLLSNCHRAQVDLSPFLESQTEGGAGGEAAPDGLPWLGRACRTSNDCGGEGLRCQPATQSFSPTLGAPPHGLCTRDCRDDGDCRPYGAAARCGTLVEAALARALPRMDAPRICLLGCTLGAPGGAAKCLARPELACRPFAGVADAVACAADDACAEGTFCFHEFCHASACGPRCNSDQDCSGARHCNAQSGLCDEQPASVTPVGSDCAETGECGDGTCLEVRAPNGDVLKQACSLTCSLGGSCGGDSGTCTATALTGSVDGDIGYCQQSCDCDADCRHPADHCLPWQDAELARRFGTRGVCEVAGPGARSLTCDGGAGNAP